jgi:hypothetical protein
MESMVQRPQSTMYAHHDRAAGTPFSRRRAAVRLRRSAARTRAHASRAAPRGSRDLGVSVYLAAATSFEFMSTVSMKPLVPLYS